VERILCSCRKPSLFGLGGASCGFLSRVDYILRECGWCLGSKFGLQDQLRPDALATVNELKRRSILVSLISGDNHSAVQTIATQLGISTSNVRSRCTQQKKQSYVKEQLLRPNSIVIFCGDGTNDAAALAQASIGMHINEGSDIAQSAADVLLMRPFLKGILTLIDLSKHFTGEWCSISSGLFCTMCSPSC